MNDGFSEANIQRIFGEIHHAWSLNHSAFNAKPIHSGIILFFMSSDIRAFRLANQLNWRLKVNEGVEEETRTINRWI